MQNFLFMSTVLQLLSQGDFFRKNIASALRIIGVLTGIGGLVLWVSLWGQINSIQGLGVLAFIIVQFLLVIFFYMVVHTFFIRAEDILELPEGAFVLLPIASILYKLIGDVLACISVFSGVAGCLFMWFGGASASYILPGLFTPETFGALGFVGGLIALAVSGIMGFLFLVFFYMLSELTVVLADIAINMKGMRQIAERFWGGRIQPPQSHTMPYHQPTMQQPQPQQEYHPTPSPVQQPAAQQSNVSHQQTVPPSSHPQPTQQMPSAPPVQQPRPPLPSPAFVQQPSAPPPSTPTTLYCPSCGNTITAATKFCGHCGHKTG